MDEILKMLFEVILERSSELKEINTISDLCEAVWDKGKLVKIFAANNDDQDGFSTEEILKIANAAYQEVKGK